MLRGYAHGARYAVGPICWIAIAVVAGVATSATASGTGEGWLAMALALTVTAPIGALLTAALSLDGLALRPPGDRAPQRWLVAGAVVAVGALAGIAAVAIYFVATSGLGDWWPEGSDGWAHDQLNRFLFLRETLRMIICPALVVVPAIGAYAGTRIARRISRLDPK